MTVAQADLFARAPSRMVPTVAARPLQLRPYQVGALDGGAVDGEIWPGIRTQHRDHRSTLAVLSTGLGKTVIFADELRRLGSGMVLAHRDSLIRQAASKLREATGRPIAIEKAEREAWRGAEYICASVQTLKGRRLEEFAARFPDLPLIVIDEGHRGTAPSYRAIYEAFPNAKLLFVTATADRSDGVGLHNVSETVAYRYEGRAPLDDGWLLWPHLCPVDAHEIDLSKVRTVAGDFVQAELDDAVSAASAKIARAALDGFGTRSGLIFTPGVKTAHVTAEALNGLRPGCAAAVDGEMDDDEKRGVEQRFKAGEIQIVANCNVYTEGFDYPELMCILDAAKTKSRLRYGQRMGRGARPWPGVVDDHETVEGRLAAIKASPKPKYHVFDLAVNSGAHTLAGPLDLLAGKSLKDREDGREILDLAAKLLKEQGGDVGDVLAEATAAIEEKHAAIRAAAVRAAREARERLKTTVGEPRTAYELFGIKYRPRPDFMRRPEDEPTPGMLRAVRDRRIPIPPNCSKGQAGALIGADKQRERDGLTNYAQVREMSVRGLDAREWSVATFRRVREAIIANGWRDLPAAQVDAILARAPGEGD